MSTAEVQSGLEGVVAFATEIAEREGRLVRPTAKYVGPPPRPLSDLQA